MYNQLNVIVLYHNQAALDHFIHFNWEEPLLEKHTRRESTYIYESTYIRAYPCSLDSDGMQWRGEKTDILAIEDVLYDKWFPDTINGALRPLINGQRLSIPILRIKAA